jgi:hemoglobin
LGEVLGGSQAYTVSRGGYATMLAHHFGKNISEAQRRRWVNLLLDFSKLPAETVADPATPMPHWSWGVPGGPYEPEQE